MQGNGASRLSWHDSSIHLLFLDTRVFARYYILIDSIFLPRRKHKPEVHGPSNHSLHIPLNYSIFLAKQRIDFLSLQVGPRKNSHAFHGQAGGKLGLEKVRVSETFSRKQ